jgi:4-hydroxy-tetrahydrodipicolinate synthase
LVTGVWLPIVTPFVNGSVDFKSYERLLSYYLDENINGVIPLGTTGESATIDDDEAAAIVELTVDVVDGRIPIYVGVGGNSTAKVIKSLKRLEQYSCAGTLSVCPYYNRPSEEGICQHFERVAECTDPRSPLRLAKIFPSIQCRRSVVTAEYWLPRTFRTAVFLGIYERLAANDHRAAHAAWTTVEATVPLFFKESNPAPIKCWLWRKGLIQSPECRLPLTKVSPSLAKELDAFTTDVAGAQ